MRLIKLAILSVVFLFLTVTAMSLFIPSHIRISRAINLPPPPDSVLAIIKDTAQWRQWHPFFMVKDSIKNLSVSILPKSQSDSEYVFQLQVQQARPVINGLKIHRFPSTDSLTLQWYMDFHLSWYPWQKFSSLFYENTYGGMMEKGLSNIKHLRNK